MRSTSGTWTGPNLATRTSGNAAPSRRPCNPIVQGLRADLHADARRRRVAAPRGGHSPQRRWRDELQCNDRSCSVCSAPGAAARQANGEGEVAAARSSGSKVVIATPGARSGVVRVGFGKDRKIKVTLTCADDGRPISGATLCQRRRSQVKRHRAAVTSRPIQLAPGRPCDGRHPRTISPTGCEAAMRSCGGAGKVSVRVKVPVSLRVRKLSPDSRTSFRGKLSGDMCQRAEFPCSCNGKTGSGWRPVATLKTSRTGVQIPLPVLCGRGGQQVRFRRWSFRQRSTTRSCRACSRARAR